VNPPNGRRSGLKDPLGWTEGLGVTRWAAQDATRPLDKERPMNGPAAPVMPLRVFLVEPVVAGTKWE
jgi:hypothetical protein